MDKDDYFPEIVHIENKRIDINTEVLEEVLNSNPDVSSTPLAFHVVLCNNKSVGKIGLIGELAEKCKSDWKSINQHLTSITITDLYKQFHKSSKSKQLVLFRHPVFSLSNDGKKTKIANFFLDIWHNGLENQDYILLSGLAAAYSSSVIYYTDSKFESKDTDTGQLKNVLSVSLKTEKIQQLQQLFYIAKCWEPGSGYDVGLQKNNKFLSSLYNSSKDKDTEIILKQFASISGCYLLQKNLELESFAFKHAISKICREILDSPTVKMNHGYPISAEEVPDFFTGAIENGYDDLVNFQDQTVFDKLLDTTRSISPGSSSNDEHAGEDDPDNPNNAIGSDDDAVEPILLLPWQINKVDPYTFEIDQKLEELQEFPFFESSCAPNLMPNVSGMEETANKIQGTDLITTEAVQAAPTAQEALSAIFSRNKKPLEINYLQNATSQKHLNEPTSNEPNIVPNVFIPSQDNQQDDENSYKDRTDGDLHDSLLLNTITAFLDAKLSSETTSNSIFQRAVKITGRQILYKAAESTIRTSLQSAVEFIYLVQIEMEKQLKTALYFESDNKFLEEANKLCSSLNSGNLGHFTEACKKKVNCVITEYQEINANIRLNERNTLRRATTLVENYVGLAIQKDQDQSHRNLSEIQRLSVMALENAYGFKGHPDLVAAAIGLRKSIERSWNEIHPSPLPSSFARQAYSVKYDDHSPSTPVSCGNIHQPKHLYRNEENNITDKIARQGLSYRTPRSELFSKTKSQPVPNVLANHQNTSPILTTPTPSQQFGRQLKQVVGASAVSSTDYANVNGSIATVVFNWDTITVLSQNGTAILGPIKNEIWMSATEIILGGQSGDSGSKPIKITNIIEYFLTSKERKVELQNTPQGIIEIFALTFLKLNNMICSLIKCQKLSIGILVPNFACPHLAQVLIDATTLTGLKIVLADHAAALVCFESSNTRILDVNQFQTYSLLVVNEQRNLSYCAMTSYLVSEKKLEVIQVIHDWDSHYLGIFKNYRCYTNALKSLHDQYLKGLICPGDNANDISKELKSKFNKMHVFPIIEQSQLAAGMLRLVQENDKHVKKRDKTLQKILDGCLLHSVVIKMAVNCKHLGYYPNSVIDENVKLKVIQLANTDKQSLADYKKNVTHNLYEIMHKTYSEDEKKNLASRIQQVETLQTKNDIQGLLNKN